MQLHPPDFGTLALTLDDLSHFSELFDSCAKLMADTAIGGGTLYCVADAICFSAAQQTATMLSHSPEDLRPGLPAAALQTDLAGMSQYKTMATANDFAFCIGSPAVPSSIDDWLGICLERNITALIINPNLESIIATDKALELRLEYTSFVDYMLNLSAVSNYLVKSIEMHVFGSTD